MVDVPRIPRGAAAPRGPLRWRAPRAWRALLAPREPRAALMALVPGDPLELRVLVAERLAARALVADAALVLARAAARVAAALQPGSARARAAAGLRVGPAWLVAVVDDALVDDESASAEAAPCAVNAGRTTARAAVDDGRAGGRAAAPRRCAVERLVERAFRHRALVERRALLAVLLERSDLEHEAQRAHVDVGTLARRVRSALGALARAVAPAAPCRCYGALPADSGADGVFLTALPSELMDDARRALAALRVLHATRRGPHTSFDLAHIERELAELARARHCAALRALLGRALERALPADSYLRFTSHARATHACTTREPTTHEALLELHELGAALGARGLACDPFAPPLAAAEQLLGALCTLQGERGFGPMPPHEVELWQARWTHAEALPRAFSAAIVEIAWRAAEARDRRTAAAAARDCIAALLDAGDPRAALEIARDLGAESEPLAGIARAALADPPAGGSSDLPWGALSGPHGRHAAARGGRRRLPAAARAEGERHDGRGRGAHVLARDPRSAAEFGASVLCVARIAGAECEVVHLDVAPGCEASGLPELRMPASPEVPRKSRNRAPAASPARAAGSPERSARATDPSATDGPTVGRPGSAQRSAGASDASAIGGSTVAQLDPGARRVVARWIRSAAGVALGWVQLEFRHGLLLDERCLEALAAAWELAVACAPRAAQAADDLPRPAPRRVTPRADADAWDADAVETGPVAVAARELVARLGVGTAQRRWSLFVSDARLSTEMDRYGMCADSSEAIADGHAASDARAAALAPAQGRAPTTGAMPCLHLAHGGGARLSVRPLRACGALQRALVSDEPVDVAADPGRLATHASAQCGVVFGAVSPLGARFVLALESARREPFVASDASAWQRTLAAESLRLDLARRSAAYAALGEGAVALPMDEPDALELARWVAAAAHCNAAVALVGPPGSGRRTLARRLHVEARRPGRVVEVVVAAERDALQVCGALDGVAPLDSAIIVGVERIDAGGQLALAARLAAPLAAPLAGASAELRAGLAVVLPAAPRVLAERGQLVPELAARLSAWSIASPPLADVRHRIPAIAAALLERVARRQRAAPRTLTDGAIGLLWRGAWPCNALDLVAVAERLGARGASSGVPSCTQAEVASAVEAIGLEPVTRLPSRDPRPRDVAGALWCTQTAGGRINKTRAAAWLGWDADTLAARLVDLGFHDLDTAAPALRSGKKEGPIRATRDGSLDLP